jgi:hypothetical protein
MSMSARCEIRQPAVDANSSFEVGLLWLAEGSSYAKQISFPIDLLEKEAGQVPANNHSSGGDAINSPDDFRGARQQYMRAMCVRQSFVGGTARWRE